MGRLPRGGELEFPGGRPKLSEVKTIELQVPDSLLLQSGESLVELIRTSQFLLAVKFFEVGRLSSGQAAQMCHLNRVDFLLELGRQGIPIADLSSEEMQEELRNV